MNRIYSVVGITKQSFHQRVNRQLSLQTKGTKALEAVREIRIDHPRMSSRMMYKRIKPVHLGRDRFEQFCFKNGFKVPIKRAFHRTTNSLGVTRFENLVTGKEVSDINQVWVSDITYYRIGETFYYLTFILDLKSRFIVGYAVSKGMRTEETTIRALQMAQKMRKGINECMPILHSDGGGQYYSKELLSITRAQKIKNSMCESVYENACAERLNGTIKNDYLAGYGPGNWKELLEMTAKAVWMYNYDRPHQAHGNISPYEFEMQLKKSKTQSVLITPKKELPTLIARSNNNNIND